MRRLAFFVAMVATAAGLAAACARTPDPAPTRPKPTCRVIPYSQQWYNPYGVCETTKGVK